MTAALTERPRYIRPNADARKRRKAMTTIARRSHILDGRHLPTPVQFALHGRLAYMGVTELVGVAREAVDQMLLIFPDAATHEKLSEVHSAINLARLHLGRIHPDWDLNTHEFDPTVEKWVDLPPGSVTDEARGFALAMVWFHRGMTWAATKYEQNRSLFE